MKINNEWEALMVLVDLVQESDTLPAKERLRVDSKVKWILKQHEQISDPQWTMYHRKWKACGNHEEYFAVAVDLLQSQPAEFRSRVCAWMWVAALAAGAQGGLDERNVSEQELRLIQEARRQLGVSLPQQYLAFGELPHAPLEGLFVPRQAA